LDADPAIANENGWNAVHLAAVQADSIFLEAVLTCIGKNNKALVARNGDWNTPLILASQEGRTKNAQMLLSFSELVKINVDLCGSYGESALLAAMKRGHKSTFEILLLNKAGPLIPDGMGNNVISYALNAPSLDFVHMIYTKGFGPNIPSQIINETRIQASLSKAIANDSIPWLSFLVKVLRPNLEKEEAISEKDTPMYPLARAAKLDNLVALYFLLKNNANPNQRDSHGNTPLMDAVKRRKMVMARCLMEFGADPNIINRSGQSALMMAKRAGHLHMIQILLSPEYALIRAVHNDDVETVYTLLAEGANPNREDGFGSSLLAKTVRKGNLDMASYLLSFGADPSEFDTFSGKSPMTLAEETGDRNMINLIADYDAQRASFGSRYY
jgi:ankyrin repeat protein